MRAILQAIKALFRRFELKLDKLNADNDKTIKSLQAEITALRECMPLMINVKYDVVVDGDVCDTPYSVIEGAFLSGRPVLMNNSAYAQKCIKGQYVVFMGAHYREMSGSPLEIGVVYTTIRADENILFNTGYLTQEYTTA